MPWGNIAPGLAAASLDGVGLAEIILDFVLLIADFCAVEKVSDMMNTGLSHTSCHTVTMDDTAVVQGSGQLEVLATPRLIALMENAAMLAAAQSLSPEETTVGGQIAITHLAPSAVGAEVSATAVLDKAEGRKLTFSVSAREGDKLIGEGTHVRFIVDKEKFMAKLR